MKNFIPQATSIVKELNLPIAELAALAGRITKALEAAYEEGQVHPRQPAVIEDKGVERK